MGAVAGSAPSDVSDVSTEKYRHLADAFAARRGPGGASRMGDMVDRARSAKEAVVEIVSGMPEDATYDEILEELVLNRMVERGLADVDAGRVISDEEMKRTIDSWRG